MSQKIVLGGYQQFLLSMNQLKFYKRIEKNYQNIKFIDNSFLYIKKLCAFEHKFASFPGQ